MRTSPPNTRHPRGRRLSLGAVCLLAALAADIDATTPSDNKRCLRCHQMATLTYRDPANGEIVNLAVDPEALAHSAHGGLACGDCHQAAFGRYPHPASAAAERLDCVGCHERQDEAEQRHYRFATIEQEFRHSIHALSKDPKVAGLSCHDPHHFQKSQVGDDLARIVRQGRYYASGIFDNAPHPFQPSADEQFNTLQQLS